jgi:lipoate synthase
MSDEHAGRYLNVKVQIINHHNPDLVLLAADDSELMRVDLTRLSSTQRIHRLMQLLGMKELCTDGDSRCAGWSKTGECERNPSFMAMSCRKACNFCAQGSEMAAEPPCRDVNKRESCEYWSTMGECSSNEAFMREQCARACGFCQVQPVARPTEEGEEKDEL